jgi:prepilin-type processing-associated H-X9-DG protein
LAARNDYAACEGQLHSWFGTGPSDLAEGDDPSYVWPDQSYHTGISGVRSEIRVADVPDGTTNTYMIGEKYLNPDFYVTGESLGDNQNAYSGDERDVHRSTALGVPLPDQPGVDATWIFGGPHSTGINMVFCDGSVRTVSYEVTQTVHDRFGNREDGNSINASDF